MEHKIRVTSFMAECDCGFKANGLTGSQNLAEGIFHAKRDCVKATITDTRRDPIHITLFEEGKIVADFSSTLPAKCTCAFVIPVCDAKEDHHRRLREEQALVK